MFSDAMTELSIEKTHNTIQDHERNVVDLQNPVHLTAKVQMHCLKSIQCLAMSFEYEKISLKDDIG